jgi:hypothetical protein
VYKSPRIRRALVLAGAIVIVSVPQYLDQVERLIWGKNNENAEVDIWGPAWYPSRDNWKFVTFKARVRFETGHIFEILDKFSRKSLSGNKWTRQFSYFFGIVEDNEAKRIFLFDTHGLYGVGGHLHPDDDERLMAGDPSLNGFSPEDIDIIDCCGFVDLHFNGDPFPWDAP